MAKSMGPQHSAQPVRALRLSAERIARILDELDEQDAQGQPGPPQAEASKRYPYRVAGLRMHLHGSRAVLYCVPTRWISASGLSFLHGCYLYEGTPCVAQLITVHGMWNDVSGVVRSCRYVDAHVYEVEMRFARRIDPALYCAAATTSRVLVADDDPLTVRIVTAHLNRLNASVDHAADGEAAIRLALEKPYDLVLMDVEMPGKSGLEAVGALRRGGYSGPVVAISSQTQPENRQRCRQAGFDDFLAKPFGRDELGKLLRTIRQEPIFSTLADEPAMRELIGEFVQQLLEQARALQEAFAKGDLQRVQELLRTLKAHGTSYGFEVLTKHAAEIEQALLNSAPLESVRDKVHRLLELCSLVRGPRTGPA